MRPLAALPACLAIALVVALGSAAPSAEAKKTKLTAFKSCSSLLAYARGNAVRQVLPELNFTPFTGGPGRPGEPLPATGPGGEGGGGGETAPSPKSAPPEQTAASDGAMGPSQTGTNVQEAGVDEPDLVKTDGRYLYVVSGSALQVVDLEGGGAKKVAALKLAGYGGGELLLSGTKLMVIGGDYTDGREQATLTLIDIADPREPRVVKSMSVEGTPVSSRLVGTVARVVVRTSPRVLEPLPYPALPQDIAAGSPAAMQVAAQQRARTRVKFRTARASAFLPRRVVRNRRGRPIQKVRAAVACDDVRRPEVFGGLETVTVLTIDLAKGLDPVDSDSVMTGADMVYASPTALYVTTQKYSSFNDPSPTTRTAIHKFSTDGDQTTYRGSGDVAGYLLNQFSLSERDGLLRVASTQWPIFFDNKQARKSESYVSVLAEQTGGLQTVGRVEGLGEDERIYSVRFLGDRGYVVTFRETDPLYVLDLADARDPRVTGELKIRGYSAYLHPVGAGLLLGIGQDATESGQRLGTQLSLFDVSDPARPARIQQAKVGALSSSEVEYDHRAFLYWPPTGLTMLPVFSYDEVSFTGAIGYRVAREGITEVGRVEHGATDDRDVFDLQIRRALVVGDRVVTVSQLGVRSSALDSLADVAFAAF